MVSSLSILCMAVSAVVAVGLPFALMRALRRQYAVSARPAWIGALAYVLSVLVAEAMVHQVVLKSLTLINRTEQPFTFMVYGALMAGVFEETARLLAFRHLRQRHSGIQTALAYGIGHGGCECALLGCSMIANAALSIFINSGMANSLPASIAPAVEQLTSAAPPMFLLGLVERFMAVGVQIALSVIVFYAVFTHRKWLYPAAIGLHAITDTLPALMQTGYFSSISIVLGWVALCMAGIGYLAWKTHCRCKFSIENIA